MIYFVAGGARLRARQGTSSKTVQATSAPKTTAKTRKVSRGSGEGYTLSDLAILDRFDRIYT